MALSPQTILTLEQCDTLQYHHKGYGIPLASLNRMSHMTLLQIALSACQGQMQTVKSSSSCPLGLTVDWYQTSKWLCLLCVCPALTLRWRASLYDERKCVNLCFKRLEVAFCWVTSCCCVYQMNIGLHFSSDTAPCILCIHLLRHVSDSHYGHHTVVS